MGKEKLPLDHSLTTENMEAMCLNWKSLSHYNFFRINHKQQSQTKSETKKLFAKSSFSNITTNKTSLLRIYFHLLIQSLFLHCSKVKVLAQSCLILCEPMDCSPPGSSIHGILQARILEWVAIPFSWVSSQPRDQIRISCMAGRLFTAESLGKLNVLY